MKMRRRSTQFWIGVCWGVMVVNFALWVMHGNPSDFAAALVCGLVAVVLVRWGR